MTLEPWMIPAGLYALARIAEAARAEVWRKVHDESLKELGADVKRINGSVTRHEAVLLDHDSEIRRLRDR